MGIFMLKSPGKSDPHLSSETLSESIQIFPSLISAFYFPKFYNLGKRSRFEKQKSFPLVHGNVTVTSINISLTNSVGAH